MSNDQVTRSGGSVAQTNGFAVGLTLFAAIMMMLVGVFQAIQGVVALFNDTFYVVGEKWTFSFDVTTWGWVHLVMGAHRSWARGRRMSWPLKSEPLCRTRNRII